MNIFGPVLLYDLIRMVRRGRYFLLRSLYASVLLGLLYVMFESIIGVGRTSVHPNELTSFASNFVLGFMILQCIAVVLMTPAYVGGAIAEEKVRQTMDYLLTTDLRNHEIILGKLVSRLANLILFLLSGLPVLSLIQLFGGVSPAFLWTGFAATLITALSLTSVSIWLSVQARKPRDAIILIYLVLICYYAGWGIVLLTTSELGVIYPPDSAVGQVLGWVQTVYESGHLIAAFVNMQQIGPSQDLAEVLVDLLWRYAAFHGVVTLLCTTHAIWRVRRVYVRQRYGAPAKAKGGKRGREPRRKPVSANAMLWKETQVESKFRLGKLGVVLFTLLALIFLSPGVIILGLFCFKCFLLGMPTPRELTEPMNLYICIAGTILGSLLPLVVGVRASGSIGSERERQTLDGLLASPLSISSIVVAKWWGSIHSARWVMGLLVCIWLLGLVSGGLNFVVFPVLLLLMAIYAGFMASLGMYFAATCKTTLRAMMFTIATALFVGGGHWICCFVPLAFLVKDIGPGGEWIGYFLVGLTPPAVLFFTAFKDYGLVSLSSGREASAIPIASIGIFLYVLAAVVFRFWAVDQFRKTCGRIEGTFRTEGLPPPPRETGDAKDAGN